MISEPEPLNDFDIITAVLAADCEEEPLESYFYSLTFLPLEIFTVQKPPPTEEAWYLTIKYLKIACPSIGEPTLGLFVIMKKPVCVKNKTVQEHTQRKVTHQQQQIQQNLRQSHKLLLNL